MHKVGDNKNIIIIVLIAIFGLAVFSFNDDITGKFSFSTKDLYISDFYIIKSSNNFLSNRLVVNVCNGGSSSVDDYDIRFILNAHEYNEFKNNVIEPNECSQVSTSFKPFMENVRIVESLVIADSTNKVIEKNENNNRVFKKLNLTSYSPNLVVSGIDIVKSGNDNKIKVRFCNKSPTAPISRQSGINIAVDTISRYVPYYYNIKPDSCVEVYSPLLSEYNVGSKREFLVEAYVDKDDVIVESDENDNYLSKRISI